jgi:hypothetical protein
MCEPVKRDGRQAFLPRPSIAPHRVASARHENGCTFMAIGVAGDA